MAPGGAQGQRVSPEDGASRQTASSQSADRYGFADIAVFLRTLALLAGIGRLGAGTRVAFSPAPVAASTTAARSSAPCEETKTALFGMNSVAPADHSDERMLGEGLRIAERNRPLRMRFFREV